VALQQVPRGRGVAQRALPLVELRLQRLGAHAEGGDRLCRRGASAGARQRACAAGAAQAQSAPTWEAGDAAVDARDALVARSEVGDELPRARVLSVPRHADAAAMLLARREKRKRSRHIIFY
jgi:hypothetical protein